MYFLYNNKTVSTLLIAAQIGTNAFYYCNKMIGNIIISKSVTTIGDNAFGMCVSLRKIYCEAESKPSGWVNHICEEILFTTLVF